MKRHAEITRDYREAGAINSLINLYGFIDDATFLTKSGDLGVVVALRGVDYECLAPEQRESVTRDFEVALRTWDEHSRLYQYVIKRRHEFPTQSASVRSRIEALLEKRRAAFEARHDALFSLSLYLVIVNGVDRQADAWPSRVRAAIRTPLATIANGLSTKRTIVRLDTDLDRRLMQFRQKVDAFAMQLHDSVQPRVLEKSEAFTFFRRLLNYAPSKADAVRLREDTFLDFDVCDSALECHRTHLRLDDDYVRVLTLKEPPAKTFPHLLQALYEIPSQLILVNEWQRETVGRVRREIHAKRRHFHNAKVSFTSYLSEPATASTDLLIDDSAAATVRDLGACLTELTLQGRYSGQYSMTVVLHDSDPAALERSVTTSMKAFAAHDAQVTDERYNLLNAWLATIPGNSASNVRSMHLLNTNYADLSLLFAQDGGSERNTHLNREALAVLDTTQGTLYNVNLHVDDVAHTLVLGATGSGKSFFLNFLVAHLQRYEPATLIFDLGGSYDALTRYFDGRVVRMSLGRRSVTINPFCLPPTPQNLQFLFSFVKVLIQAGAQYTTSRADDQALYEQIESLYVLDSDQRRLFTLANILPRRLSQQLQPWVQGGQYGDLFDHVEDTLTFAPFQYVDFEGLDTAPLVLEPLLFYLLYRSNPVIADDNRLKVFVIDEAWRFLRDPTIRLFLAEALKTWRKKNACVLLATQTADDLQRSELLRVIVESCPTKCFLSNPHIDRAAYQELFHLNQVEVDAIASLTPRQQILFKQPHISKVLNLHVDADSAKLFSAPGRNHGVPFDQIERRDG